MTKPRRARRTAGEGKPYRSYPLYIPDAHRDTFHRLQALAGRTKHIGISSLVFAALHCCIDTLEEEVPKRREFYMNGVKVEP